MADGPDPRNGVSGAGDGSAPRHELITTSGGDVTVIITREDGQRALLHSRFDPVAEARTAVRSIDAGPLDTVVLFGMGLGYPACALAERLAPSNCLLVVERDPALFQAARERPAFRELASRPRTFFFVGCTADDLFDFLIARASLFLAAGLKLVRHGPSIAAFPAYYERFLRRIDDFVRTGGVMLRTTMYLSRTSFSNRVRNLPAYLESPGVLPYRGRFAGRAGVVVSAGPSLAKNMDLLREVKGRAPIVAVSTALKALLGRGIVPDFAVIIDYAGLSRRYFEDVPRAGEIPLVCDLKANATAVEAYRGPTLFGDDSLMNALLGGIGGPKGELISGSTVAHAAYHFTGYLGCDPIIFVGQDLAYTGGELHVPGTAVYQQSMAEFNRFYTAAMKELEYALAMRPRLRTVEAWGGGTVRTCDVFSTYLEEFEGFFRKNPQRVIDATEGGAAKRGTERMLLRDAVREFVGPPLPASAFEIPAVSSGDVTERLTQARERLERIAADAAELESLYDRAIRLVRKVLAENERGRAADQSVAKVLRIKEKLRDYELLYALMTQLAQSDLFVRLRRDRELDGSAAVGIAKQKQQAERDLEYLLGLRHALTFFRGEIEGAPLPAARVEVQE